MRRASLFLSTLIITALLLTACGAEETGTPVGTDMPPVTVETTPTDDVTGTETVDPDLTTTPGVPVTGEESPSRMTNLLDFDVWDRNGEQIGDVEDMILDMDNTRISYVVVGTGGFLGLGEKEVLVPWDMLELRADADAAGRTENAFVFTGDPEFYNNAPDVDVDSILPDWNTPAGDWDVDIRNFWQSGVVPDTTDETETPAADVTATPDAGLAVTATADTAPGQVPFEGTDLQGVVLATEVLGSVIQVRGNLQAVGPDTDATADPLATATPDTGVAPGAVPGIPDVMDAYIEDIIVDPESGEILYLVITAGFLEGERWIPVPIGFLQWNDASQNFILRVNAAALQNAPFFADGLFPDFTVDTWDDEFDTFWQNPDAGADAGGGAVPTATP